MTTTISASGSAALQLPLTQQGIPCLPNRPTSTHGMKVTDIFACLRQRMISSMPLSSGDTIPNCLGEFREIRESKQRAGIALYGHPAGTPGATGVERLRPRENVQRLGGSEWGETDSFSRRNRLVR